MEHQQPEGEGEEGGFLQSSLLEAPLRRPHLASSSSDDKSSSCAPLKTELAVKKLLSNSSGVSIHSVAFEEDISYTALRDGHRQALGCTKTSSSVKTHHHDGYTSFPATASTGDSTTKGKASDTRPCALSVVSSVPQQLLYQRSVLDPNILANQFDLVQYRLVPPDSFQRTFWSSDAMLQQRDSSSSSSNSSSFVGGEKEKSMEKDIALLIPSLTSQHYERSRDVLRKNFEKVRCYRAAEMALLHRRQQEVADLASASSSPPVPSFRLPRSAGSFTLELSNDVTSAMPLFERINERKRKRSHHDKELVGRDSHLDSGIDSSGGRLTDGSDDEYEHSNVEPILRVHIKRPSTRVILAGKKKKNSQHKMLKKEFFLVKKSRCIDDRKLCKETSSSSLSSLSLSSQNEESEVNVNVAEDRSCLINKSSWRPSWATVVAGIDDKEESLLADEPNLLPNQTISSATFNDEDEERSSSSVTTGQVLEASSENMMPSGASSSGASSERSLRAEQPLLFLPVCLPLPNFTFWVKLRQNVWSQDEKLLKSMPYFGDDDTEGFDMTDFDRRPWEIYADLSCEVMEVTAALLMDKYESDPEIRRILELQPLVTRKVSGVSSGLRAEQRDSSGKGSGSTVSFSGTKKTSSASQSPARRGLVAPRSRDDADEENDSDNYRSDTETHLRSLFGDVSQDQWRNAFTRGRRLNTSLDYIRVLLLHTLVLDEGKSQAPGPGAGTFASNNSIPSQQLPSDCLQNINSVVEYVIRGSSKKTKSFSAAVLRGILSTNNDTIFEVGSMLHSALEHIENPIIATSHDTSSFSYSPHPLLPLSLFPLPCPLSLVVRPPPPLLKKSSLSQVEQLYNQARSNYLFPSSNEKYVFCSETGLRYRCKDFNELNENIRFCFCRRCYTYGCVMHGAMQPYSLVRHDPTHVRVKHPPHAFPKSGGDNQQLEFDVPFSKQIEKLERNASRESKRIKSLRNKLQKQTEDLLEYDPEIEDNLHHVPFASYRYLCGDDSDSQSKSSGVLGSAPSNLSSTAFSRSEPRAGSAFTVVKGNSQFPCKGIIAGKSDKKMVQDTENGSMRLTEAVLLLKMQSMVAAQARGGSSNSGEDCQKFAKEVLENKIVNTEKEKKIIARLIGTCQPFEVHRRMHHAAEQVLLNLSSGESITTNNHEYSQVTSVAEGSDVEEEEEEEEKNSSDLDKEKYKRYGDFKPCHHEGPCTLQSCYCIQNNGHCEKFCACSAACKNRFAGCNCSMGQCRTNSCPCRIAERECDPDLCLTCGVSYHPSLISASLSTRSANSCLNCPITRGLEKKLSLGRSELHGIGCFAREDVKKDEFIVEYLGEVISTLEGERRGKLCDKRKCTYLFDINNDSTLDAMRKGNIIKFGNSSKDKANCYPRYRIVNADHRIALYASRDINSGEELMFDYGDRNFVYDDENWVYNACKKLANSTNGNSKTKISRNSSQSKSATFKCDCGKEYSNRKRKFFDAHKKVCNRSNSNANSKLLNENKDEDLDNNDMFSNFLDSDDSSHYI